MKMYPVNDYLILEELQDDDLFTKTMNETNKPVLYKPPTDNVIRKYRVVHSAVEEYQTGDMVAVLFKDVVPFFDGEVIVKADLVVAEQRQEAGL